MNHYEADPTTGRHHSAPANDVSPPLGAPPRHRHPRATARRGRPSIHTGACPACSGFRNGVHLAILEGAVRTGRMAPRAMTLPGERLSRAVLEEAISDLKRGICLVCATSQQRQDCLDAYRWFNSTDTDWPLSFENVCYRLNCDAASVRDTIRRVKRAAVEAGCA